MSEYVLTFPTSHPASHAASSLLVQAYVAPHLTGLQVAEGSELSLKGASPEAGNGFLPIFKTLLQAAGQQDVAHGESKEGSEEFKIVDKWIQASTSGQDLPLKELDEHLKTRTYIANGKLTAADVAVFAALNTYIAQASHDTRISQSNITRHFDLLQNTPFVVSAISKVSPNLVSHTPIAIDLDNVPQVERKIESSKKDKKEKDKAAAVAAAAGGAAAPAADGAAAKGKGKKDQTPAAAEARASAAATGEPAKAKKEKAKKEPAANGGAAAGAEGGKPKKEKGSGGGGGGGGAPAEAEPITPGLIDLRVGKIVDVKKHPDADSLYVEQIDVGEAEPRTVVSGLVNYIPIEEMQGKVLIAVCNLKPASMRGVKSFAMVLAATSPDGKTGMGSVELVAPPEGSNPGDRVYFEGYESVKALEQLPPKKKIFETIQPGFTTLDSREAAWIDPADPSKIAKIRTEKGYCKAPNFVGASLS